VRIEHWAVAQQTGRIAALNMMHQHIPGRYVPVFWTVHYGGSLRYCGSAKDFDDVLIDGDLAACKFVAYYCIGEQIQAVCTWQRDPAMSHAAELIRLRKMPTKTQLKQAKLDLTKFPAE